MRLLVLGFLLFFAVSCFSQKVNPLDFGAKGDGITDDLPALNSARDYAMIMSYDIVITKGNTKGVYRTTGSWVFADSKWIQEDSCYKPIIVGNLPANQQSLYAGAQSKRSLSIYAEGYVCLFADFNNGAAIYWGLNGYRRNDSTNEIYKSRISGLNIYARQSFNGGKNTLVDSFRNNNNQQGIVALYNSNLMVDNLTIHGFKTGILSNNAYFHNLVNLKIVSCGIGVLPIQSHGGNLINVSAYYCDEGFRACSNQLLYQGGRTEHCRVALRVLASDNKFQSCYFENQYAVSQNNEAQVIIGDGINPISSVTFDILRIANTVGKSLTIKDKVQKVVINGGGANPTGIMIESDLTEVLVTSFFCNSITGKGIYIRDADITAKSGVFNSSISAVGTVTGGNFITPNSITANSVKTLNINVDGEFVQKTQVSNIVYTTKNFIGLNSKDYIVILGKYNVADGNFLSGTLKSFGYSVYSGFSTISVNFKNQYDSNYLLANISGQLTGRFFDVSLVKFTFAGLNYIGVRYKLSGTTNGNFSQYYFRYDGLINTNNTSLTCVDVTAVTDIQLYTPTNFKTIN